VHRIEVKGKVLYFAYSFGNISIWKARFIDQIYLLAHSCFTTDV